MTTSKIKSINEIKEWAGAKGTVYYHNLEMENGDKINIGKKNELKVGDEITYEIVEFGQQEYQKSKSVQPQQNSGGYQKDQEAILYQNHLTNVVNHFTANGFDSIDKKVNSMKDWVDVVSQVTIALAKQSLINIQELKK